MKKQYTIPASKIYQVTVTSILAESGDGSSSASLPISDKPTDEMLVKEQDFWYIEW